MQTGAGRGRRRRGLAHHEPGRCGIGRRQVTDSQSVGGGPDSGQMPPDAKQVPEDQLQGGGEVTFSS